MVLAKGYLETPLGLLEITANAVGITSISFTEKAEPGVESDLIVEAKTQLIEYFSGKRSEFDLEISLDLPPFHTCVLDAVQDIPYGTMRSYGQIARELGAANMAQAVGSANAKNPILIVIPCHRVVASNGDLTGYSGGLERKRKLLEMEGALRQVSLF
ncbi:methylated-DNA--[protein]-cysteine S-methyltransferase [bacterium]|nr:methylated-DNA--[protein]-cysteine S-methyltransferase [bacterium]